MTTPRTTPFTFVSLLFLLLHVLVPAIALPVQQRPSFARSLYTPSFVQGDTALLKGSHATLIETPLFPTGSPPDSLPIAHSSRPSSRLFGRTFLDPYAIAHASSLSPQNGNAPTGYRVAPKLDRRGVFDKIKQGFQNLGNKVKQGFQTVGNKIKQAAQTVGNKVKQAAQTVGNKVKQGFQKVKQGFQIAGNKIKQAAQTVGNKVKQVAQKAGKWVKDNGAKVAKFGLKVWSTAQSVGARVVKYALPGIGKPISAALQAASMGVSKLADKIPAKLDPKLEKGMKVMDKIQHPLSGTTGAIVDKILRRDFPPTSAELLQRDFIEEDELSRRDLHELDERAWDGDFDIEERSWSGDSDLSGHSVPGDEDARSFHIVESQWPLFRKDP